MDNGRSTANYSFRTSKPNVWWSATTVGDDVSVDHSETIKLNALFYLRSSLLILSARSSTTFAAIHRCSSRQTFHLHTMHNPRCRSVSPKILHIDPGSPRRSFKSARSPNLTPITGSSTYSPSSIEPLCTPYNAHSSFELEVRFANAIMDQDTESDTLTPTFRNSCVGDPWTFGTDSPSSSDISPTLGDFDEHSISSCSSIARSSLPDFLPKVTGSSSESSETLSALIERIDVAVINPPHGSSFDRHQKGIISIAMPLPIALPSPTSALRRLSDDVATTSPIPVMLDTVQDHRFFSDDIYLQPEVITVGHKSCRESPALPEIQHFPAIDLFSDFDHPHTASGSSSHSKSSSTDSERSVQYSTTSRFPHISSLVDKEPFITGLEGWEPVSGLSAYASSKSLNALIPRSFPTRPAPPIPSSSSLIPFAPLRPRHRDEYLAPSHTQQHAQDHPQLVRVQHHPRREVSQLKVSKILGKTESQRQRMESDYNHEHEHDYETLQAHENHEISILPVSFHPSRSRRSSGRSELSTNSIGGGEARDGQGHGRRASADGATPGLRTKSVSKKGRMASMITMTLPFSSTGTSTQSSSSSLSSSSLSSSSTLPCQLTAQEKTKASTMRSTSVFSAPSPRPPPRPNAHGTRHESERERTSLQMHQKLYSMI